MRTTGVGVKIPKNFTDPLAGLTTDIDLSLLIGLSHSSSKRFSCRYCDSTFSKPVDVRAHQKRAHPLTFPCMFCDQVFKQVRSQAAAVVIGEMREDRKVVRSFYLKSNF